MNTQELRLGNRALKGLMVLLAGALASGCVPEDEPQVERLGIAEPTVAKRTFETLKTLEGVWEGDVDRPGSGIPVRLEYEVASEGEAVLERVIMPDMGPKCFMFTVYYMEDDALRLTHYCAAGNQPRMILSAGSSTREAKFGFEGITGLDTNEIHVRDGIIRFVGDDQIEAQWRNFGAEGHLYDNRLYLRRVSGEEAPDGDGSTGSADPQLQDGPSA